MQLLKPLETNWTGRQLLLRAENGIRLAGDFPAEAAALFVRRGIHVREDSPILVEVIADREAPADVPNGGEWYSIAAEAQGESVCFAVRCAAQQGLRHAVRTLCGWLAEGQAPEGALRDAPGFGLRGVVEGFYGQPWPAKDRLAIMDLMETLGMNSYFYGPKNDVFHREKWNAPYDTADLDALRRTARAAAERGIEFWYCMGPGLTIAYSRPADFDALVAKVRQVLEAGIRHVGLFLDDIPPILQDPGDMIRFSDLTDAHIWFVSEFAAAVRAIDPAIKLALCPQQYCGSGTESYITRLGRGIPEDVLLLWTGSDICSKTLTESEADRFAASMGRLPLYWDNYPVNDANMTHEMHLGPLLGRGPELGGRCAGLLTNGMESAECTKIPLITIGAYLWNPRAYDPEAAWTAAIEAVAGDRDAEDFRVIAVNLRVSCLGDRNNAEQLGRCLYIVRFLRLAGRNEEACGVLAEYLAHLDRCDEMLRRGMDNAALQKALAPWLEKHRLMTEALTGALGFLQTGDAAKLPPLRETLARYHALPARYADFCFTEFIDDLTGKYSGIRCL